MITPDEEPFINAIVANFDDLACWYAYADWLLENDQEFKAQCVLDAKRIGYVLETKLQPDDLESTTGVLEYRPNGLEVKFVVYHNDGHTWVSSAEFLIQPQSPFYLMYQKRFVFHCIDAIVSRSHPDLQQTEVCIA